jgi:hypothetical protein
VARLHINIIQRTSSKPDQAATLDFMWDEARRRGLPATTLVTYAVLYDEVACARLRERVNGSSDSLGVHFHDLACPRYFETYRTKETAVWLLPRGKRAAVIDEMVALFTKRFGYPPVAVGSYVFDAWTLRYFAERHPSVKVAITNCFEEGVNMFRGNNHNWHLFSDGGPWGPFWPSKSNALVPARDADEAIDIVALPHLNRDMILSLSSRDDWFSSHPPNLIRAKINDGDDCPYNFRFIYQWAEQAEHHGWEYLNTFVSCGWLTEGHWACPDIDAARQLYQKTLDHYAALASEGRAVVSTMEDFAAEFRNSVKPGEARVCHWRDILRPNPKRQVVWLGNSHYRAAIDLNIGGTICDLRAYDGRIDGDMGPETTNLSNGSYPFLISSEHRGGFWNSGQNAFLHINGREFPLWDSNRLRATVTRNAEGNGWSIEASPAVVEAAGITAKVVSRWHADDSGAILLERELVEISDPSAELAITEWFGGCFGTTEYPEDLRGIRLHAEDVNGKAIASLNFSYSTAETVVMAPATVCASIPQAGVEVRLHADGPALEGKLSDGCLFSPYFGLRISQKIHPQQPTRTWLKLAPLPHS